MRERAKKKRRAVAIRNDRAKKDAIGRDRKRTADRKDVGRGKGRKVLGE